MPNIFSLILSVFFTLLATLHLSEAKAASDDSLKVRKRTYVHMLHADATQGDEKRLPNAIILVGDVQLRRDSMYMYCDSAYLFRDTNSVKAFGNVRMEQGDTLFLYGDYADYNGDSNIARVRRNVRLEDKTSVLETDSLNYDRNANLAYYFNGGTLYDEQSTLDSEWGEYNLGTKLSVFTNDVTLHNPQFIMNSDTLHYNTADNVATIVGPTEIISGENRIKSRYGHYNTNTRQATLLKRSVVSNGNKDLTGDSLFYDALSGFSEAFGDIIYNDTVGKNMLVGEYGYMNEFVDSAYVTDRAVVMDYSQGDTLYMHADTIWAVSHNVDTDSVYRLIRAFHHVRAYRNDMQAVCDSMIFDSRDSCLTMYKDPIMWYGNQQLLGEEVKIYMDTASIDWVHIINQTLFAEQMDSVNFNQISGQEMKFFFKDKKLDEMQVIGSVMVRYYPLDSDNALMGMNRTESGKLTAFMKNDEVYKILIPTRADGVFYPMGKITDDVRYLDNFVWFDYVRPKDKDDIFNWRGKRAGQQLKKIKRQSVPLPTLDTVK